MLTVLLGQTGEPPYVALRPPAVPDGSWGQDIGRNVMAFGQEESDSPRQALGKITQRSNHGFKSS
jgi:hypothetical protein